MWQRNTATSPNPIDPVTGGAMKQANPIAPMTVSPRQRAAGIPTPRRTAVLSMPKGLGALPGV